MNIENSHLDNTFQFSYNFNDINQLIFSYTDLLETPVIESPVVINPSINSATSQNTINVTYTQLGASTKNISAILTKLSICRDFFNYDP